MLSRTGECSILWKWVCIEKSQSLIISREGLILTLSILPCPQGRISGSTPCRKIDDERLSVLHQNSGGIGKSIPSRFPSTLEISLGLRPREISRVSGNLSGVGDGFPNTSLVLVEHGYNPTLLARMHAESIPVEWNRLTVLKSILP